MKKTLMTVCLLLAAMAFAMIMHACGNSDAREQGAESRHQFIKQSMLSGGPPKDGIPALDEPVFVKAEKADIDSGDIVFGVDLGDFKAAFPRAILYWHEIVNFTGGGLMHSLTYCPLTGTAIGFLDHNLGVSGRLYNSNLVMYDRATDGLIPQIYGEFVDSKRSGDVLKTFPVTTTTWKQWSALHPDTLILTRETGYERDYGRTPYPGYEETEDVWFKVTNESDRLHKKEVVVGLVVDGDAVAVKKRGFAERHPDGLDVIVGGVTVHLDYDTDLDSITMQEPVRSFEAFWFAWYAFYPETRLID